MPFVIFMIISNVKSCKVIFIVPLGGNIAVTAPPPKKKRTNKPAPDYSEIKMLFLIPTSNNFIIRMKSERKEWLFKYCELTNRPSNMKYFCAMCKGNSFDLLSRLDISSGPVARGHQKLMADHHFSKTDKFWWPDWATKIL